jgi:hypothetical protein
MSHKNDPDYHDIRAKILLEAARHLNSFELNPDFGRGSNIATNYEGLQQAVIELRRMASGARREHRKVLDKKRRAGRKINPELAGV